MNRVLLVLSIMSLLVDKSHASGGEALSDFQQICIADLGTGFNWENGAWKSVNFIKPKYLVTKVSYPDTLPQSSEPDVSEEQRIYFSCTLKLEERNESTFEQIKIYNSCLRVQEFGDDRSDYYPCDEVHVQRNEGQPWSIAIYFSDDNFYMTPSGHFHTGTIHSQLEASPKNDYKDSLAIFVGKCANIAN